MGKISTSPRYVIDITGTDLLSLGPDPVKGKLRGRNLKSRKMLRVEGLG